MEFDKINKNKNEISKIKKNNESLLKENKNLLKERDILNQEKGELSNQLEQLKKEINEFETIKELKELNLERKKELKKLKEEYNSFLIEHKNLQDNYDRLINKNNLNVSMSMASVTGYQLSPDEYEEYELLRKNKDENEALILQLKSNNQAKEVEKKELKEILKKLDNKK